MLLVQEFLCAKKKRQQRFEKLNCLRLCIVEKKTRVRTNILLVQS